MKNFILFNVFICLCVFSQDDFSDLDIPELDNLEEINISDVNASLDTSLEEQELLNLADKLSYKIPDDEWGSIKDLANVTSSYTVKEGDWLFKISKNLFGTGHYYPKIWALNPYITNPHDIEPGMLLVFNSSASVGPELTMGGSPETSGNSLVSSEKKPKYSWEEEKARLISQGIVVDYASDEMRAILEESTKPIRDDYKIFNPPSYDDITPKLGKDLTNGGVSSDSKTKRDYKQGFSINTFVSNERVDSLGRITDAIKRTGMILNSDTVFVSLDRGDMAVGDTFSVYETLPPLIQSQESERSGYQTVVHGHIKLVRRLEDKWEAEVFGGINSLRRGMKIMKYTPKLKRIKKRYSTNQVESYVIGSYDFNRSHYTLGDIVFLDRGLSDGVKLGYVFGTFDRKDRFTQKNIQRNPTYLTGELTVISVTEEFSTALVTKSFSAILKDSFAITIPEGFSKGRIKFSRDRGDGLDELSGLEDDEVAKALNTGDEIDDLEKELENLNDDNDSELGNSEELDDDELSELENIIDSSNDPEESDLESALEESEDEDLKDLEDIVEEEEVSVDEEIDIEELEEIDEENVVDDLDDLESIEKSSGKQYLEEELNEKDNPFGLTENDLEEVDELMNLELD